MANVQALALKTKRTLKSKLSSAPKKISSIEKRRGTFLSVQKPLIRKIDEYLLAHQSNGKRMSIKKFCELADVNPMEMSCIMNGHRWLPRFNRSMIEKIATILEIPVMQVYALSGFIKSEDFVFGSNVNETLNAIYRQILQDKHVSFKAPSEEEWNTWPLSAKLSVCMIYESLIEKKLLRYADALMADEKALDQNSRLAVA